MDKKEKPIEIYKAIRIFIYIIQLFILVSIEQVPGLIPEIYGGRPLLILPLFLSVVLLEGNYTGFVFGLISGITMELSFGKYVGLQLFIMGLMGYILGKVREKLFEINIFTFIFFCILIEPLFIIMRFYLNYGTLWLAQSHLSLMLINHVIPGILYTVLVSPVIYLFNRPVFYFIREKEVDEH